MFGRFRFKKPSVYDEPIEKVLEELRQYGPDTPEYPKMMKHLNKLTKMKAEEGRQRVSSDTVLLVLGNLAGILIIVAYERMHVMTSKATGFLQKPR